ncbi:uncharacterized protein EI90DRAFT_3016685 [Cantharellus anzutake]|uniref:uncharacterized protein n=1 Tax=Cantharellus anzutake TaxID=1750568 RepID=UPI00190419F6|nr:uncharacterized protein EI90DRAFT_3016685 [Cantharellus anzutake]KAF8330867.1 hypothetical protein EI90DRAFT_3016685 [Cantharellus anzutake]
MYWLDGRDMILPWGGEEYWETPECNEVIEKAHNAIGVLADNLKAAVIARSVEVPTSVLTPAILKLSGIRQYRAVISTGEEKSENLFHPSLQFIYIVYIEK